MTKLICVGACYLDTILRHVLRPQRHLRYMAREDHDRLTETTHQQRPLLPGRGHQATRVQPGGAPRRQLSQYTRGATAAPGKAAAARRGAVSDHGAAGQGLAGRGQGQRVVWQPLDRRPVEVRLS